MADDSKDQKDNDKQAEAQDVEFEKAEKAEEVSADQQDKTSEEASNSAVDQPVDDSHPVEDSQLVDDSQPVEPLVSASAGKPFLAESGKKPSKALALLALFIALISARGAGFLGWQWYQRQDTERQYQQLVTEHQKQISQLRTSLEQADSAHRQQLASRDQQISQLQNSALEAEQKIDAYARRLQRLTATTTDDWRLAEVEYLLGLANQRILTSKDASTAVNLLETADDILLELADPRLFDLRKTVAADKAALQAVGKQDIDGAFLELAALSQQVSSLQVLVMPAFTADTASGADSETENEKRPVWVQKIVSMAANTWREIRALVVVQRVTDPIEPLLPPEQQFYLKSNLRLLLGKAQLALLDGRQQVYSSSLQTASQWVQSYFPQQFAANRAMYEALVELEKLIVSQDYPDASASLLAVRAFIAEQHRLPGKKSVSDSSGEEKQ